MVSDASWIAVWNRNDMIIPLVTRCTYDGSWKHDKMTLKFGDSWLRSMDDSDASNFFAKSTWSKTSSPS